MKRNLMRLAAVGLGLFLSWALLESGLRILQRGGPGRSRPVGVYENRSSPIDRPLMRHSTRPRGENDTFRLLVVGDSFTWGDGIYHEDTYGRRLESLLERMNGELDVDLTLFSRPGWNTQQEYDAVRRGIRKLAPDLILLGFCLNDAEPRNRAGIADLIDPLARRRPTGAIGRFFHHRSRLVALVWERLENSRQTRAFNRYYRELFERPGWQASQEALDDFRQLAWDAKAPLAVALFPVFDQPFDRNYSYLPLHRKVMEALRQRDIVATDLFQVYRGVDTTRLAVEPFTDPHPNELAHRIASQHLAHFLIEQQLVPVTREQRGRIELSLRPKKRVETER